MLSPFSACDASEQAHEDGPAYFPVVAIVSLGASAVIKFTRKRTEEGSASGMPSQPAPRPGAEDAAGGDRGGAAGTATTAAAGDAACSCGGEAQSGVASPSPPSQPAAVGVYLPPRSLLLFSDEAYTAYLHSIDEVAEDLLDETVANAPDELKGA